MADSTLTNLTAGATPVGADLLYTTQAGASRKITAAQLQAFLNAQISGDVTANASSVVTLATVPVAKGGTGSTTAAAARTALGVAASGSNADITALTGLTTPLSIVGGGTGTATPSLVAGANVTITGAWPNHTIGAGATGLTQQSRLNQLAASSRDYNQIIKPKLAGSIPWKASTAYVLGNVVSKLGLTYICVTAGTSAGSGGPTGRALNQTDGTVHWDYYGPQTAPAVTVNSASHNAALTKIYDLMQGQAAGVKLADLTGRVRVRGGPLEVAPSAYGIGTPCVTIAPGTGNFGGTRSMYYCGLEFIFEGTTLELKTIITAPGDVGISVDGQYLDYAPVFTSANNLYHTLDFTNVASNIGVEAGTSRQRRRILIEFQNATFCPQIACDPTGTIGYASTKDNFSVAIIGDSQVAGGGTEVNTRFQQSYSVQLMHRLGLPDMTHICIGGTGFTLAGASTVYGDHAITDLQALDTFRAVGLIIVQSSQNDNGRSGIQAAALSLFQALRTAFPVTPIIVTGCVTPQTTNLAATQTTEGLVFAAVDQRVAAGDALIFKVPTATDPAGPWLTGSGHVGATNGTGNNDFDVCSDGSHLSQQGHTYWAARMAESIAGILSSINTPF